MNEQVSEFTKRMWEYFEKKRLEETGIVGYCACCGAPHYVGKEHIHDKECIWYERTNSRVTDT